MNKNLGDYEVIEARIKDMELGVLINYGDYEYLNKMEEQNEFR